MYVHLISTVPGLHSAAFGTISDKSWGGGLGKSYKHPSARW